MSSGITYKSAERFMLSREFFGMKLGLDNIRGFMASIGDPQLSYDTVHISGTNGKGSVATMLASVLSEAGYRTGLFTSPHLVDFRERVKVDGKKISKQSLIAFVKRHRSLLVKKKLSFFEAVTALALENFQRRQVDIAIIETGLGGRLDATNCLSPLLTVTTEISRDHVEILGNSLTRIAREKAGIIKPECDHLIGILPLSAERVMSSTCRKQRCRLHKLNPDSIRNNGNASGYTFSLNGWQLENIHPALIGEHQKRNVALVLHGLSLLNKHGYRISNHAARRGLKKTDWPARFQIIRQPGKPTIVLDVCHNATGTAAFVDTFKQIFPGRRAKIILGMVKRKEHDRMIDSLLKIGSEFQVVRLSSHRSTDTAELCRAIINKGATAAHSAKLSTAYNKVLNSVDSNDILTIVGSHYLAGEFLKGQARK